MKLNSGITQKDWRSAAIQPFLIRVQDSRIRVSQILSTFGRSGDECEDERDEGSEQEDPGQRIPESQDRFFPIPGPRHLAIPLD